jgi:hypothetical protein
MLWTYICTYLVDEIPAKKIKNKISKGADYKYYADKIICAAPQSACSLDMSLMWIPVHKNI